VAANLTFIEARALTGPGYYAAQVFEGLAAMADAGQLPFRLHGYVQDGARHHFSDSANAYLTGVGTLRGRAGRVAFEQLMLPFRSKRDKVDLLWSPGFVSPLWGPGPGGDRVRHVLQRRSGGRRTAAASILEDDDPDDGTGLSRADHDFGE
jgi:hypothetical protein